MTEATHLHASGRYTCDVDVFARYVRDCIAHTAAKSFTCTERYGRLRRLGRRLRKMLGPDWLVVWGGEYVTGVRLDTYRRPKAGLPRTAARRLSWQYSPRKAWMDLWTFRRTFIHREIHKPVLFAPLHVPKVEHGDAAQKAAGWAGLDRAGRAFVRAQERRPNLVVVAPGDFNADHHKRDLRERIKDKLGMLSCWSARRPDAGTHGPRLIDAIYSTAPMRRGRIPNVPLPRCADHRAIVCTLDLGDLP